MGELPGTLPNPRVGVTGKVEIMDVTIGGIHEGYITGNVDENGVLKEVFLHGFGRAGSTLEGWTQFSALLFSLALQGGPVFNDVAIRVAHMKFEPYGRTDHPEIPWCNSAPGYIVHWLALRFAPELKDQLSAICEEVRNA